jgi:hypothetical protein
MSGMIPEESPRESAPPAPVTPIVIGASATPSSPPDETAPANKLTPEEQMALFEKELKETDWGHQPC